MAKIMKITGYLAVYDEVDETVATLEARDALGDRLNGFSLAFTAESTPLGVDFLDDAWDDHPLNRINCTIETCEQYFNTGKEMSFN